MTKCLLIFGLLALNGFAWGQTACPGGVSPGDPRCGPSPSGHSFPSAPKTPPESPMQVRLGVLRSGAFATDSSRSSLYWVTQLNHYQGSPEYWAVKTCEEATGGKCASLGRFTDQCAAVAIDQERASYVGYDKSWKNSARHAMAECNRNSRAGMCRLWDMPVCSGIRYSEAESGKHANQKTAAKLEALSAEVGEPKYWGAIAVDGDEKISWSEKGKDKSRVEKTALDHCRKQATDKDSCKILISFSNSHAVIVRGSDDWPYTVSHADLQSAQDQALKFCRENTTNCAVTNTFKDIGR